MNESPSPAPNPPTSPTCRLLDGSGICADYRVKIEKLHDAAVTASAQSKLIEQASSVAVKAAWAVAVAAITGLGSLSGYLWYRFMKMDSAMSGAARYSVVPVGRVLAWTGPIPARPKDPDGKDREPQVGDWHFYWRECDGTEIPLEHHEDLNAVVGATYGKADPGHVKLPDFRGYFLRGEGERRRKDGTLLDRASGPIGEPQAPYVWPGDMSYWPNAGADSPMCPVEVMTVEPRKAGPGAYVAALTQDLSAGNLAGSRPSEKKGHPENLETRPANYAVHWIIRVR